MKSMPFAMAMNDGDLNPTGQAVRYIVGSDKPDRDLGMGLLKPWQPRHQPHRGEGLVRRDGKPRTSGLGPDLLRRICEMRQGHIDAVLVIPPGLRQLDRPMRSGEKPD